MEVDLINFKKILHGSLQTKRPSFVVKDDLMLVWKLFKNVAYLKETGNVYTVLYSNSLTEIFW